MTQLMAVRVLIHRAIRKTLKDAVTGSKAAQVMLQSFPAAMAQPLSEMAPSTLYALRRDAMHAAAKKHPVNSARLGS